jgi:hypothetical protein
MYFMAPTAVQLYAAGMQCYVAGVQGLLCRDAAVGLLWWDVVFVVTLEPCNEIFVCQQGQGGLPVVLDGLACLVLTLYSSTAVNTSRPHPNATNTAHT